MTISKYDFVDWVWYLRYVTNISISPSQPNTHHPNPSLTHSLTTPLFFPFPPLIKSPDLYYT